MKKFKIVIVSVLVGLILGAAPIVVRAQVNNDVVLGYLIGFAQNNNVSGGNFLGGVTGGVIGGVNTTGTGTTNPGTVIGTGGLTGGILGSAVSSNLNYTGVNFSNATNTDAIAQGYAIGQYMANVNNSLGTQGLSLASMTGLTIPGMSQTGVGGILQAVMGAGDTANAITNVMNAGFMGMAVNNATAGLQGGALNAVLTGLGLSGGNNMGLSSVGQLAVLGLANGGLSVPGLSAGLSSVAGLSLLNSAPLLAGSNTLVGTLLGANAAGGLLNPTNAALLGGLLSGNTATGSLLGTAVGSAAGLFTNGQLMTNNAALLASSMLSGSFLGSTLGTALNSALGSALGSALNSALGTNAAGLAALATGALASLGTAVTSGLSSLTSSLANLFNPTTNPVTNAVTNAVNTAVANATSAFTNTLASALGCTPGVTPRTPTTPTDPGDTTPLQPNPDAQCGNNMMFRGRGGNNVDLDTTSPEAVERFRREVMFRDGHGDSECSTAEARSLMSRLRDIRDSLARQGHSCESLRFNVYSAYRDPHSNSSVGGARHSQHMECTAVDFNIAGVSSADLARTSRIIANQQGYGGVGYYGGEGIHVDVRGGRADWGPSYSGCNGGGPLCGQYNVTQ